MSITRSDRIVIVSIVLTTLFVTGCGKMETSAERTAEESAQANDLKAIGQMYEEYLAAHKGNAPTSEDDLEQNAANVPHAGQAIQGIKSGKYIIIWNSTRKAIFKTTGSPNRMSGTILGYEKDVPTAGGMVLMINGSTRHMTAAEFQAAPKAKGK